MSKRISHSSPIREIEHSDGSIRIHRPTLLPARRQFGYEMSEDLLSWASTDHSEGAKRINSILGILLELLELNRKTRGGIEQTFRWQRLTFNATTTVPNNGYLSKFTARQQQLSDELNGHLSRYKLRPWHWCTLGDFPILGWWSGNNRPRDPDDPDEEAWFTEWDAIVQIIELARVGEIARIRRCTCGHLFFFKFIHQKFCCVGCQQEFYRSSPGYKAMRRAYMKNLRAAHKKTFPKTSKRRK
jgi:hypothetical protein